MGLGSVQRPSLVAEITPGPRRFPLLWAIFSAGKASSKKLATGLQAGVGSHRPEGRGFKPELLSVPKRLRYYLQRDKGTLNAALRIFLRVVQQSLQIHCPGAAKADPTSLHLGAVAFIHRFDASLNTHVHFHVCVGYGVFEAPPDGVIFHAATGLDEAASRSMPGAYRLG